MAEERVELRATFDEAALLYDEVRPGYPEVLFDDVVLRISSTNNLAIASPRVT